MRGAASASGVPGLRTLRPFRPPRPGLGARGIHAPRPVRNFLSRTLAGLAGARSWPLQVALSSLWRNALPPGSKPTRRTAVGAGSIFRLRARQGVPLQRNPVIPALIRDPLS